jgi:hypothetical protein
VSDETASASELVFRPKQSRFLSISESPLCYWLPTNFFRLMGGSGRRLVDSCEALEGLGTRDDVRFLRFWWETTRLDGFVPLAKGGGYCKWYGDDLLQVAWGRDGERIKAFNGELYGGSH